MQNKYLELLMKIREEGYVYDDPNRPGVERQELASATIVHDMSKGFPLLNVKPIHFKSVYYELLWFLNGLTDANSLNDKGVKIWNADSENNNGNLGPIYGKQWVDYEGVNSSGTKKSVNQIDKVVKELENNPMSSSLVVSAWNPVQLKEMALPPCHYSFQLNCEPEHHYQDYESYKLNLTFNMRSVDTVLGLPFNMMSYALLVKLICIYIRNSKSEKSFIPGSITFNGTKVHIYGTHDSAAAECIIRGLTNEPVNPETHKSYLDLPVEMLDQWETHQFFNNDKFSGFTRLLWENDPIIKFPYYKPMSKLKQNTKMLPYG